MKYIFIAKVLKSYELAKKKEPIFCRLITFLYFCNLIRVYIFELIF